MRTITRLLLSSEIKSLIDVISNVDGYPKNVDAKRGNETTIQKALAKGLIEEYSKSSGIAIGDTHFKHVAYRLTAKGRALAISSKEEKVLSNRKSGIYAWLLGIAGAVIAGLILYFLGV